MLRGKNCFGRFLIYMVLLLDFFLTGLDGGGGVILYSPVSIPSAAFITLHRYLLVTGPSSFISQLNFMGSKQPGNHKS